MFSTCPGPGRQRADHRSAPRAGTPRGRRPTARTEGWPRPQRPSPTAEAFPDRRGRPRPQRSSPTAEVVPGRRGRLFAERVRGRVGRRPGTWWAPRPSKPTRGRFAPWRVRFPSASATPPTRTAPAARLGGSRPRDAKSWDSPQLLARPVPRRPQLEPAAKSWECSQLLARRGPEAPPPGSAAHALGTRRTGNDPSFWSAEDLPTLPDPRGARETGMAPSFSLVERDAARRGRVGAQAGRRPGRSAPRQVSAQAGQRPGRSAPRRVGAQAGQRPG
jgi:hypothetical protein